MQSPRFTGTRLAFLTLVPLAWGVLLFFHPVGDTTDFYPTITASPTEWQVVHVGMMIFIPLMGGVIYTLLRGVEGRAAQVGRIAVFPFVVFYGAFELLVGVGTGILVAEVNALPEAEQAVGARLVEDFAGNPLPLAFTILGGASLVTALLAAGVAFSTTPDGTRRLAPVALLALSAPLIGIHEPPAGPAGLALFIGAVLLVARDNPQKASREAPANSSLQVAAMERA